MTDDETQEDRWGMGDEQVAQLVGEGAPALETPETRMAPLETPEAPAVAPPVPAPAVPVPAVGVCVRCGTHTADVFDGTAGPFCGSGCLELARRGL